MGHWLLEVQLDTRTPPAALHHLWEHLHTALGIAGPQDSPVPKVTVETVTLGALQPSWSPKCQRHLTKLHLVSLPPHLHPHPLPHHHPLPHPHPIPIHVTIPILILPHPSAAQVDT